MFATSIFYAVVGVIFLAVMFMSDFPPHIGIIGIFSLVAAYGLYRKRAWAIWFVLILFFAGTAFSAFIIYDVLASNYILGVSVIVYLILTWAFTAYAATRRNTLEG